MIEDIDKYKQHVNHTVNVFTVLVMVLFCFKIAVSIWSISHGKRVQSESIFLIGFSALFGMFIYKKFLGATENNMICGKPNHVLALGASIGPFLIIYCLGMLILTIFPGWRRCFSNTFGTGIVKTFYGLDKVMEEWIGSHSKTGGVSDEVRSLYNMIEADPEALFNELVDDAKWEDGVERWNSFEQVNRRLKLKINIQNPMNQQVQMDLKETVETPLRICVAIKEDIGLGLWVFAFGLITIQLGFNSILAQECTAFTKSQSEFQEYLASKISSASS